MKEKKICDICGNDLYFKSRVNNIYLFCKSCGNHIFQGVVISAETLKMIYGKSNKNIRARHPEGN